MPSQATVNREFAKENAKRRLMKMKPLTKREFIWMWYPEAFGRKNSGGKMTKLQRLMQSSKRAKQKRMAKALKGFLKVANPSMKCGGAKIRRNKGSITIIPIKLPNPGRRARR